MNYRILLLLFIAANLCGCAHSSSGCSVFNITSLSC